MVIAIVEMTKVSKLRDLEVSQLSKMGGTYGMQLSSKNLRRQLQTGH